MRNCLLLMLCLTLVSGPVASALAESGDHARDEATTLADSGISLDEAVARAERRHGARAVRAEERRRDDHIVYRIRLLGADGRVFEITVDAKSGQEI